MAAARQRSVVESAAFQQALRSNYRWWARLRGVTVVQFLGVYRHRLSGTSCRGTAILAQLKRPTFPKGVCTGCGCSFFDPCIKPGGECCAWTDATETRCTHCSPTKGRRR